MELESEGHSHSHAHMVWPGAKKVYLTDLPYTLDNLKECIKLNKAALKGEVVAEPLDWYRGEQGMERGWH